MSIEAQRAELQRLYIAVIAADGMASVHRLLSDAVIAHRRGTKKKQPAHKRAPVRKPNKPHGALEITWKGTTLRLGPAMRRCTPRGQLFVLGIVHDGLGVTAATRQAGYKSHCDISPTISAAIAEECRRVM